MTKRELQTELSAAQETIRVSCDQYRVDQETIRTLDNKYKKLEVEFAKLQDQVRRLLSENKNFKQVIQNLGECIAHL